MEIKTNLSPRNYTEKEVCRIINPLQAKMYIKNRVFPIDVYTSFDSKGNDIIVYIFLRKDTQEVYNKWLNYDLK
jgi:hypothetical protein